VTMTKRDLVTRVAEDVGMARADVAKVVEGVIDTLSSSLVEGERWELRGFGVLETRLRAPRVGRNPRTGEPVDVPERRVVSFRPGKKLADRLEREDSRKADPV